MKTQLLIGLALIGNFGMVGCINRDEGDAADEEQSLASIEQEMRRKLCEGDRSEVRIARLNKCQSETMAACQTQVFGSATPTKAVRCADPEKLRKVWKCMRDKYGDDTAKIRSDRKRTRECADKLKASGA